MCSSVTPATIGSTAKPGTTRSTQKDGVYDILDGGLGDDQATYDPNDLLHDLFSTPA
jgi:hypothetical protein